MQWIVNFFSTRIDLWPVRWISITLSVIMARTKLKLFQFLQQIIANNEIRSSQLSFYFKTFNYKILFAFLVMIQFGISSVAYMIFQANSIGQRADSLYMSITEVTCLSLLAYNISKFDSTQELIENCEKFIEKRKR